MTEADAAAPRKIEITKPMQRHILAAVLQNPSTLARLRGVLDPAYFDDDATADILAWSVQFWDEHKECPSRAALLDAFEKPSEQGVIKRCFQEVITDLKHTEQRIVNYAKNRAMRRAILQASLIVSAESKGEEPRDLQDKPYKKGKVPDPVSLIQAAQLVGVADDDMGQMLFDPADLERGIQSILHPVPRDPFTSGCEMLDQCGLTVERGEVGCVLAATSRGKSHCLINAVVGNSRMGRNVVLINVEMPKERLEERFYKRIAGSKADLKTDPEGFVAALRRRMPNFALGRVNVKRMFSRVNTMNDVRAHIIRLVASGFKPDLLVIDYVGVLKPPQGYDEVRHALAALWLEFRSVCQEFNMAGWSAAQTNRGGMEAELVTTTSIGESYEIATHLDVGYSISMTEEEKAANQGRFFVFKSRNSSDGAIIEFNHDYSRSLIVGTGKLTPTHEKKRRGKSDDEHREEAAFASATDRRKKKAE